MITAKKAVNAVGGKTARACDGCLLKRARWYCVADDAFLCQGCDSSVHSANQLASRHERVRLEKASSKAFGVIHTETNYSPPAWHQGFTRKARTPRNAKPASLVQPPKEEEEVEVERIINLLPLVPEIRSEEALPDENEEQLLYRVPIFDPFAAELCNEVENTCDQLDNLHGFLPSDMDLADFAFDVESLLGTGLNEDSYGIEGFRALDCKEEDAMDMCLESRKLKVEDEDEDVVEAVVACQLDTALVLDLKTEAIDNWNFDYESLVTGKEEKVGAVVETTMMYGGCKEEVNKRNIFLRLNYEAVITAWASQGSPWTTRTRPELNPDDCWPDFMGYSHRCGGVGSHVHVPCGDAGREARVSRYREKRRTRLFSKKIRYQVRKLNAEKKPRLKGRFVKRASFAVPAFSCLMSK